MLGPILLSRHNLHHYQQLMAGLRDAIAAGRLEDFVADFERPDATGDLAALCSTAGRCNARRRLEGGDPLTCVGPGLRPRRLSPRGGGDGGAQGVPPLSEPGLVW